MIQSFGTFVNSKLKIIVVLSFILSSFYSNACDICGCQLSGVSFGLLSGTSSHYMGLRYTKARFGADLRYNSELLQNEYSNDLFTRTELVSRYILSSKFQLQAVIPYIHNEMEGNIQNITFSGIGDPMLLLFYNVLGTKKMNMDEVAPPENIQKVKHTLLIGGGIKAPLGKFDKSDQGETVNRNFQEGTGSFDFLISANYTLTYKRIGINLESSYKINTRNQDEYLFGNQFNASSYLFYSIPFTRASLSPFAGVFYENAAKHKDDIIDQINTGGNATYGSFGIQWNWDRISVNALLQTPIDQNYNTDHLSTIEAENRFTIGLVYHFVRKEKPKKNFGFQ